MKTGIVLSGAGDAQDFEMPTYRAPANGKERHYYDLLEHASSVGDDMKISKADGNVTHMKGGGPKVILLFL